MTNFLHWRKMTWALVVWSGVVLAWMAATLTVSLIVVLAWLGGTVLLALLWLATQPLVRQGRGYSGVFIKPGWRDWRMVDLHRTYMARETRHDVG